MHKYIKNIECFTRCRSFGFGYLSHHAVMIKIQKLKINSMMQLHFLKRKTIKKGFSKQYIQCNMQQSKDSLLRLIYDS